MTWEDIIDLEKQKDYYKSLEKEINKRYETTTVFPEKQNIFKAFSLNLLHYSNPFFLHIRNKKS